MSQAVKKVATNLPAALLSEAMKVSGLNQTQALIAGLHELVAERRRRELLALGGNLKVAVDTNRTRERRRVD